MGAFKFQVRGWSLTLQTAIIAALLSGKLSFNGSTFILVLLGVVALGVIFLFHFLENQQEAISRALGRRSLDIEAALDLLSIKRSWPDEKQEILIRRALERLDGSPRLGATMQLAARQGNLSVIKHMGSISGNLFYFVEYALTVLAFVVIYYMQGSIAPASAATVAIPQRIAQPTPNNGDANDLPSPDTKTPAVRFDFAPSPNEQTSQ